MGKLIDGQALINGQVPAQLLWPLGSQYPHPIPPHLGKLIDEKVNEWTSQLTGEFLLMGKFLLKT